MTTTLLALLAFALPSQSVPGRLLVADVDGDGLPDVVELASDGVHLKSNLGGGRFDAPRTIAAAVRDGLWLDLDLDGDFDLLLCAPEGLCIAANQSGELVPGAPLAESAGALSVASLDLDGDPLVDLHLRTEEGELLLRNLGGLRFEVVLRTGGSSQALGVGGVTSVGGMAAAAPTGLCAGSLFDMALGGCITASSLATLGQLYPLSADFNVDPATGFVGMGTTAPLERLDVAGRVRAQGGLRFGDGSLQTSAFDKNWSSLVGTPAGFADGIDNDTLYSAGVGLSLAAGVFGLDLAFGDARYWNEGQSLGGDLTGSLGASVVDGLQGRAVSAAAPSASHVLKWNGSAWAPAADADTITTYGAGSGLSLTNGTFSVAPNGVTSGHMASDPAALAKVSGNALQMSGSVLRVNTTATSGRVNIGHSSQTGGPQLQLVEQGGSAYGRLQYSNLASPSSWTLAGGLTASADGDRFNFYHSSAGDVLSVSGQSRVGVRTVDPLTALHVAGSLHLQGTGQDISVQSGEQMQFGHYDGTTFVERMRIDGGGTLHLGGDVLAPTETRWLSRSASEFALIFRMALANNGGDYLYQDGGVGANARTGVHLPHGAQITALRARVVDSSPDANVLVVLYRQGFNSVGTLGEELASTSSSGNTGTSGVTINTSAISNGVIDTQTYEYFVKVIILNMVVTGDVQFHQLQIEYSTPASLR